MSSYKVDLLINQALTDNMRAYASWKDYTESEGIDEPTLEELQEDHVRGEVLEQQIHENS